MSTIAHKIKLIRTQIRQAEIKANRERGAVKLLAVSKTKPAEAIASAYHEGLRDFGESYLQEALNKQKALGAYDITWHFIGPIQSNKTKPIACHFDWVHSIDRFKIAQRLSEQRPDHMRPLNVCLQVNISREPSKSGVMIEALPELVAQVIKLPKLKLRGVMAIPAPQDNFEAQRKPYHELVMAAESIRCTRLDTFSFGMTDDLEAAIAEGATIIRIGTALFGARN
jgi:PLP dependent protein